MIHIGLKDLKYIDHVCDILCNYISFMCLIMCVFFLQLISFFIVIIIYPLCVLVSCGIICCLLFIH